LPQTNDFQTGLSADSASLQSPEIEVLLAISARLGASRDLSETFEQIMEILAAKLGMERGTLTLLDRDTKQLGIRVAHGLSEEEMRRGTYKIGEGITGKVVETGGPVVVPSIGREPLFLDRTGARRNIDRDNIAFLCVPLKLENEVVGVLSVDKVRSGDDTLESDLRLLTIIASMIAQAVRVHGAIEEILTLQERTDRILAGMPDGVLVLSPTALLQTVNEAAKRIFGFTREEVADKHYIDAFENFRGVRDALDRIYDDPAAANTLETNISRPDTEPIPVAITWSVLTDEPDNIHAIVVNVQDLTEVKRIERQWRRSQRLAELGTVAAGVAHEVRNPLSGIRGASQLLARESDDETKEFLDVIIREVDRLDHTVEQLLDLARPMEAEMSSTPIEEIVDRALSVLKSQLDDASIRVKKKTPSIPGPVNADAGQLTQVFLNLFLNAIQAMPEGGTLTVTIQENKTGGSAAAAVAVDDTGHGMSQQTLEHIFMPFYTDREKGTGLGLAISHKIVEEHGGTIDVKSEEGKGSTFIVSLPVI
jgi:PAS domain S-box-containing protein